MSGDLPIQLDERMAIAQAKRLHPVLMAALSRGSPIAIDGTRVQQIDGSSLQLLVSLWRTAADQGVACAWTGASNWLTHAAGLIGVAEALQLPR
jgi:phospholipid transport system transporter-binding protein